MSLEHQQIKKLALIKNELNDYSKPYYATGNTIKQFHTDFNQFPYPRFYRGEYNNSHPIILDREPGYAKMVKTVKYDNDIGIIKTPAPYFFQMAASTVLPLKNSEKWDSREFHLNKSCVFAGQI
jgi:hypothetical protein